MNIQPLQLKFYNGVVVYPLLFILSLWLSSWFIVNFSVHASDFSLYPRRFSGLIGVFTMPFIHGSLEHLFNNSIPLFLLSMALFYFYRKQGFSVMFYGVIATGLLTWCFGRNSYHIGASGLVYCLFSFVFFKGIFSKKMQLVALSLVVIFYYGSMVWYLFPIEESISWEGHLSGFIVGLILAIVFRDASDIPVEKVKPISEKEIVFLKHFDEHGNFIPESEWKRREEEAKTSTTLDINFQYVYKEIEE